MNLLFKTLESQDYAIPVIPNTNPPNPNVKPDMLSIKSAKIDPTKEIKPIIPVSELPNLNETVNGSAGTVKKELEIRKEIRKSDSVSALCIVNNSHFSLYFTNKLLHAD